MPILHQQLRRIGFLVCLILGAFLLSHSINALVADALYLVPDRPSGSQTGESAMRISYAANQHAEDIRSSGLFLLPPPSQGLTHQEGIAGPVVRASLGAAAKLRLIGVVLGDQRGVFTIVEELSSKKQSLYRLHDQIPEIGEVSEIRRDGMVLRQGNVEELLELAPSEKPAAIASTPTAPALQASGLTLRKVIDRREVEQAMSDLPKLLTQARAVPNMVNGTANGFRLDYIAPASFYEKIGVRAGDILQRVNGVDIRDPSTMLSLLQQLKNERVVKLELVRNDQHSTVTYELR
jgi:general secretion pathway protein C